MSRKSDRARARAAGPQVADARRALAGKADGGWTMTLRLRARYAARAAAATVALNSHRQKADDLLALVVSDGGGINQTVSDWRYARDKQGREIIVDRLDQAATALGMAFAMIDAEREATLQLAEVDALLDRYDDKRDGEVEGPTAAMIDRMKDRMADPMQRLADLGSLSEDDLSDAREIAAIFRYATSDVRVSSMRFEYKSEGEAVSSQRTAAEAAEWSGLLHAYVYQPWCRTIGYNASSAVIALAVEGKSLEALRRDYGTGWATMLSSIRTALKTYRNIRRGYVRSGESD